MKDQQVICSRAYMIVLTHAHAHLHTHKERHTRPHLVQTKQVITRLTLLSSARAQHEHVASLRLVEQRVPDARVNLSQFWRLLVESGVIVRGERYSGFLSLPKVKTPTFVRRILHRTVTDWSGTRMTKASLLLGGRRVRIAAGFVA